MYRGSSPTSDDPSLRAPVDLLLYFHPIDRGKMYVTNNGGLKFVERPGKLKRKS